MKKTYLLFLGFAWNFFPVTAQNTDSLTGEYYSSSIDTNQVQIALSLAKAWLSSNPDTAAFWALKATTLARKNSTLEKWAAASWNSLGMAYYYGGKYPEAIEAFKQYHSAAYKADDKKAMGTAKNNQGNIWIELGRLDSTLALYNEALQIRLKNNDTFGIAQSFNNIGYVYKELGQWENAIENMLKALRTFESLNDSTAIGTTYVYLGVVFQKKNEPAKAQVYLRNAQSIFLARNDERNLAITYDLLGNGYKMASMYDSARIYFEMAGTIYASTKDTRQMALQSGNLADMYRMEGKYKEAIPFYERAIALNHGIGNQRGQGSIFISFAHTLALSGAVKRALSALDSAQLYMSQPPALNELRDYHATAAVVYEANGMLKKALESARLHGLYHDSVLNETNIKAIADMETKYQAEKKEQQIALQKIELSKKNLTIGGISILSGLLLLLGFSYYRRQKLKQDKALQQEIIRQQELASMAVLKAEELERRRIATELHDGVGQLMSAARMNLEALALELQPIALEKADRLDKVVSLVDESCREVRAVSHSMMPNALLKKGLASALNDFIQKIDERVLHVQLHMEGMQDRLVPEVETVLYRLIQESVNNVIKHARANRLDISILREKNGMDITIEDNGQGFDPSATYAGIGLQNMRARIKYLKGEIHIDSALGKGTLVHFFIPLIS